jgi:hypothetical protein
MPKRALTPSDVTNARAIAERLASGIFDPPGAWVQNGALHGVTEEMLADLLTKAVKIGFDCGVTALTNRIKGGR